MFAARALIVGFIPTLGMLCGSYQLHAQEFPQAAPYVILRPTPHVAQPHGLMSSRFKADASAPMSGPANDSGLPSSTQDSSATNEVAIAFPWSPNARQQPPSSVHSDARHRLSAVPTQARQQDQPSDGDAVLPPAPRETDPTTQPPAGMTLTPDCETDRVSLGWGRQIYTTYRAPYAYGWFGAGPNHAYRARSFGYYQNHTTWTFD